MKTILSLVLVVIAIGCSPAQEKDVYAKKGVAIDGYDAVAYFTDHAAVAGKEAFRHTWHGATWYFQSQASLDTFRKDPERYAPQYGGYCAFGASRNYKAPTDPTAFTIVGNKLYLNYNHEVKDTWIKDTTTYIQKADSYWSSLK